MKTECLIIARNSALKGKRAKTVYKTVYVLVNLLTTERNIVKNIFDLLNVLFNKGKNFDRYSICLANNKEQWALTLGNDYTEEDILTRLIGDKSAQHMIHEIEEELEEDEKITVKLL